MNYIEYSNIFKALSDPNRLKIIDILSCYEMCGCKILKHFDITQPTFTHHMNILKKSGLVTCRKEGTWCHYKLNLEKFNEVKEIIINLTYKEDNSICNDLEK